MSAGDYHHVRMLQRQLQRIRLYHRLAANKWVPMMKVTDSDDTKIPPMRAIGLVHDGFVAFTPSTTTLELRKMINTYIRSALLVPDNSSLLSYYTTLDNYLHVNRDINHWVLETYLTQAEK